MEITTNKIDRAQIEFTVEVPFEDLKLFLEKGAERLSEKMKIKGFREGKAPYEVVKREAGEMAIYEEAAQEAIHKTYYQALEQEKLLTVGSPRISVEKLALGNPLVYKATVSLFPEVKVGDYSNLKIKKQPANVTDEKISQTLDHLRKTRAKETLVDRPVKDGDRVEIDFDVFVDNIPIDNGAHKKYPLIIGQGSMIPGFEEQLVGLAKDQTKEFKLPFPKDYHAKNLAGKEADFKVKLLAVYQIDLPELNDQFAKTLGQFNSLPDLKRQIKQNLEAEEKMKIDHDSEVEMLEKLMELSRFGDLPDVLVNNEINRMVHELKGNIEAQGLKWDDYLNSLKKKEEDLKLELTPGAIKRVKVSLMTHQIARDQKIEADSAEVEAEIKKQREIYKDQPQILENLSQAGYRDYLRNVMINKKVIQFLKEKIIVE
ncbi:MAG TPA: trigger factor [Patescibacteria group bacterium]